MKINYDTSRKILYCSKCSKNIFNRVFLFFKMFFMILFSYYLNLVGIVTILICMVLFMKNGVQLYKVICYLVLPIITITSEEYGHAAIALYNRTDERVQGLILENLTLYSIPIAPKATYIAYTGDWEPYIITEILLGGPIISIFNSIIFCVVFIYVFKLSSFLFLITIIPIFSLVPIKLLIASDMYNTLKILKRTKFSNLAVLRLAFFGAVNAIKFIFGGNAKVSDIDWRNIYDSMGDDINDSIDKMKSALNAFPFDSFALVNLGLMYDELGEKKKSSRYLRKAAKYTTSREVYHQGNVNSTGVE